MRWRSANNRRFRVQRSAARFNRDFGSLVRKLHLFRMPIPTVVDGVIVKGPPCPYCGNEMAQNEGPSVIPGEWTKVGFVCHGPHTSNRPVYVGADART